MELPEVIGTWKKKGTTSYASTIHNGMIANVHEDKVTIGTYIPAGALLETHYYFTDKGLLDYLENTSSPFNLKQLKGKKVYISGKMTGLKVEEIFENFETIESKLLTEYGAYPLNPDVFWHLKAPENFSAEDYLKIDKAMIDVCDCVLVQTNWQTSSGAKEEIRYAEETGKPVYFLKTNLL